jgi:urate oxidase
MSFESGSTISYGKACVPVYRVYANPLTGIQPIPESSFTGRDNTLFALEVDVEVFGNNFLPSYTHGDNSNVVATDSMKNFVLREALTYQGTTYEGFLSSLGHHFLSTYEQMESLRLTARELAFVPAQVPQADGGTFGNSNVLYSRSHNDYAFTVLDFERDGDQAVVTAHRCGRLELQLFKVTGSSFTHFVRDEYTTLPERVDRPLFIYLDVYWKYANIRGPESHPRSNGHLRERQEDQGLQRSLLSIWTDQINAYTLSKQYTDRNCESAVLSLWIWTTRPLQEGVYAWASYHARA